MAVVLGRKGGGGGGGGGAPTGPAGGDLSGTYPNPALSVAKQAELDGKVAKALYDANTILAATTDDTPAALTVGASTFVGRKAAGNIAAMSATEAAALLTDLVPKSLFDAKGDILAASADNTPAVVTAGANGTVLVADSAQSAGLKYALPPGYELGYAEKTSNTSITATTTAGATTVVTLAAITYAAVPTIFTFGCPAIDVNDTGGFQIFLFDGSNPYSTMSDIRVVGTNGGVTLMTRITPSAGSHTFSIRAKRGTSNGTIEAGAGGGTDVQMPAFIRATIA